jgi:nicotinamide-nucleotide amidase
MKAEIISVGTELLLGQIANTNAQYISRKLAEIGVDVYFHTAVGDNEARLREVIGGAQKRSELIIFTGGLGPTKDDLTKETISRCLGKNLSEDKTAMNLIEKYFEKRNIKMTENNRKQAQVIEGSTVFPNDHGMAPGMAVGLDGIRYILLPGPPKELNPMFDHYVIPYLHSSTSSQQVVHSKVLRFFGIGESALEEELIDLIDNQTNPTVAPLAGEAEVTIRLTAKAKDISEANERIAMVEKIIFDRVGQFVYGFNDDTLPGVTCAKLKEKGWKLAVAESCTGGLLSRMITTIPGCSSVYRGGVVSYATEVKESVLSVSHQTIEQYGAVSSYTAMEMAANVRKLLKAEVAISITGVAGPDKQEGKPVGLIYVGLSTPAGEQVYEINLSGKRESIQLRAAKYGLYHLFHALK